ncbi:MAG: hypothetical protein Q9191_001164 [Dirinaria sp. TL-2023a]
MFARTCTRALRTTFCRTSIPSHTLPHHSKRSFPVLRHQWPLSRRPVTTRAAAYKLWHENPISVTLASILILFGASTLVYLNFVYKWYIVDQYARYPELVAQKLRRAVYYTNVEIKPKHAMKYYRQALEVAKELRMDPFSDEVLGIRFQVSRLMEVIGDLQKAIYVLEGIQQQCKDFVEDPERGGHESNRVRRYRVLKKMIGVSTKLGELYADDSIGNQEAAEEKMVWAVTTVLKENERRAREGLKEGEGEWLDGEEMGAALELNNLSVSLALQNPPPVGGIPSPSSVSQISSARTWAQKALAVHESLQNAPTKTEECDQACAVTRINLGEFAEMEGNIEEARKIYEQGVEFSRKIGFQEGVVRGREALRRLDKGMA